MRSARPSVLMVSYQYAPATDGGAERQAQRQAEALAKRGWSVAVVTARWPGLAAHEHLNGVDVHRVFAVPRAHMLSATFLPSLARFLLVHGRRYDVWHVHQAYYNAWIALELARVHRRPTIVKLAASGQWGDVARIRGRPLESRVVRRLREAAAIVSLNSECAREARAIGIGPERIHLIANGIDTAAYCPPSETERGRAREALGIPEDEALAVFSGRLVPEKGILDLLAAWPSVTERTCGRAHLVVAGGGDIAGIRARAAGHTNVQVVGKVADIRPILAAADMLVLPSYSEGVSNAVLEAMAMAVPVVGTRIPGIMEAVSEGTTGLLVRPAAVDELGQAISRLACSPTVEINRIRIAARERAQTLFEIERVVDRYESLYHAVAGPRRIPQ